MSKKKLQFYQDKIKKLLGRNEIQKCLMGKKMNSKGVNLQQKLEEVHENAEEQARALITYFKNQQNNQEIMIRKTVE